MDSNSMFLLYFSGKIEEVYPLDDCLATADDLPESWSTPGQSTL